MALRAVKVGSTFLSNPERWAVEMFHGALPGRGMYIDEQTALRLSTVFSCIRFLSETIGTLPVKVFKDDGDGNAIPQPNHYLSPILHDEPNPFMAASVFREALQGHLCGWGNAYAEIVFDGAKRPKELWPIPVHTVTPRIMTPGRELVYDVVTNGEKRTLPARKVLALPGFGYDGIKGYSPIQMARRGLGLAMGAEEHGVRFYENDARPGVVFQHPQKLTDKAYNRLKESISEEMAGVANAWKPKILEEGMKIEAVSIPHSDAQFLETRKFQVLEICRWFRVAPHFVFDLERATFSNIEQQSLENVIYTLRPYLVRWEQEIQRKLFGVGSAYYAQFNVEGLLRGDYKTRMEGHSTAIEKGIYTRDEARKIENLPKLPKDQRGGDTLIPVTMRFANDPVSQPVANPNPKEPPPPPPARKTNGSERSVYGDSNP